AFGAIVRQNKRLLSIKTFFDKLLSKANRRAIQDAAEHLPADRARDAMRLLELFEQNPKQQFEDLLAGFQNAELRWNWYQLLCLLEEMKAIRAELDRLQGFYAKQLCKDAQVRERLAHLIAVPNLLMTICSGIPTAALAAKLLVRAGDQVAYNDLGRALDLTA